MAESDTVRLIDVVVRQSDQWATMTFEELVTGCTPDEREQLAWHLAMIRARKTFEELRRPKAAKSEGGSDGR